MGGEVARAARALGKQGMPWQREAWDIGLEYEVVDGRVVPAYREVIVSVMRQSGKTTLAAALIAHRCTAWLSQPQRVIYTAQDGQAARAKLFADVIPLYERSAVFDRLKQQVYRGVGPFEGMNWKTGSTIRMIGSAEDAGHGATETGLAIIDESFADKDDRREQALSPGMITVLDAQTWNTSTAGTEASFFLRRKIEAGRAAAERGDTSGLCYIEYSIPDDADCDDPEVWWEYMPALGYTVSEAAIAHERRTMSDNGWRRAYGNQWTAADERVIPAAVWQAAVTDRAPSGELVYAVEVHPDRERSTIVVCGGNVLELVASERGVDWVVPKLVDLKGRHGGRIRLDGAGPAAALLSDLDRSRVDVEVLAARDVVRACGSFYDALVDGRLKVRADGRLDSAAAAVTRRMVGDAWCWSRRSPKTDVTPIMALSLAAPLPDDSARVFAY